MNLFGYTYKIYDIGYKTEMMSKECNAGDPLETHIDIYANGRNLIVIILTIKNVVYRHADNSHRARVFVDGRESAMDNVTLHHNDSSDRIYKSTRVHPLLKLITRSE